MEIRRADPHDYEGARAVQQATFPREDRYDYASSCRRHDCISFVAIENDRIIGFVSILVNYYTPNPVHVWELLSPYVGFIGVLPEFQGRHVGEKLLQTAVDLVLKQLRRPRLWLECLEKNMEFYEKNGFVRASPERVRKETGLTPKGPVYCIEGDDHSAI